MPDEGTIEYLQTNEPFRRGDAPPPGNEQSHGSAVGDRQRFAVHLPCEKDVRVARGRQGEPPPHVGEFRPLRDDLNRAVAYPRQGEDVAERRAAPDGVADRVVLPRCAFGFGLVAAAAIAGAFDEGRHRPSRQRLDLSQRQRHLSLDETADFQSPGFQIQHRCRTI